MPLKFVIMNLRKINIKILKFKGEIVVENIISMNDMEKKEILDILELAKRIENCSEEEKLKFLHGKIIL